MAGHSSPLQRATVWVGLAATLVTCVTAWGAWWWSVGVPFLVVKHACPGVRWSALTCPGLRVHSVYRLLPPVEGVSGWIYDPCADSLDDLVTDRSWVRLDITAGWWQPRAEVDLPFLGSEMQRPRFAPIGTQTAAWGSREKGFAVAFSADYFGPVCGKQDPEHYEVAQWPTPEEWRDTLTPEPARTPP